MSRKRICARDLAGGPGTCWHWWDGCPKGVGHCFIRFIREATGLQFGGAIDLAKAKEWEAARDAALHPPPPPSPPPSLQITFDFQPEGSPQ